MAVDKSKESKPPSPQALLNTNNVLLKENNRLRMEVRDVQEKNAVLEKALELTTRGIPAQKQFWMDRAKDALLAVAEKRPKVI